MSIEDVRIMAHESLIARVEKAENAAKHWRELYENLLPHHDAWARQCGEQRTRAEKAEARVAELETGIRQLVAANDESLGWDRPRPDIAWRDLKRLVAPASVSEPPCPECEAGNGHAVTDNPTCPAVRAAVERERTSDPWAVDHCECTGCGVWSPGATKPEAWTEEAGRHYCYGCSEKRRRPNEAPIGRWLTDYSKAWRCRCPVNLAAGPNDPSRNLADVPMCTLCNTKRPEPRSDNPLPAEPDFKVVAEEWLNEADGEFIGHWRPAVAIPELEKEMQRIYRLGRADEASLRAEVACSETASSLPADVREAMVEVKELRIQLKAYREGHLDALKAAERICIEVAEEWTEEAQRGAAVACGFEIAKFAATFRKTSPAGSNTSESK